MHAAKLEQQVSKLIRNNLLETVLIEEIEQTLNFLSRRAKKDKLEYLQAVKLLNQYKINNASSNACTDLVVRAYVEYFKAKPKTLDRLAKLDALNYLLDFAVNTYYRNKLPANKFQ